MPEIPQLQHFLDAQDACVDQEGDSDQSVYEYVLEQLKTGVIPSYSQMWYIFPRVVEGDEAWKSHARRYSIKSYREARAYYFENDLYSGLRNAIDAVRESGQTDLDEIFGRAARKFRPWFKDCITLFAEVETEFDEPSEHAFRDALTDFFGGERSQSTLDILRSFPDHPDSHPSEFGGDITPGFTEDENYDEDVDMVDADEVLDLEIEEPEYTVKGFIASRVHNGALQYQADWDWRVPDLTFYPATNFRNASPLLKIFHDLDANHAGPSVRFDTWLAAYHRGEIADSHEHDNTPVHKSKTQKAKSRRGKKH